MAKPLTKTEAVDEYDRDEFVDAAARAFFVSAWASAMEEAGVSFSGMELMDVAPETPKEAVLAGRELAKAMAKINHTPLRSLWVRAATEPGKHDSEPTLEDFGHYSAMAALGHGVSWFDNHPSFLGEELPDMEFYVEVDPDTGKPVDIWWE